jgi:hypothetical protein
LHLFEYENVELVGSDVAFRASAVLTVSPDRVVIVTPVVPMESPVATPHLMAGDAHGTVNRTSPGRAAFKLLAGCCEGSTSNCPG